MAFACTLACTVTPFCDAQPTVCQEAGDDLAMQTEDESAGISEDPSGSDEGTLGDTSAATDGEVDTATETMDETMDEDSDVTEPCNGHDIPVRLELVGDGAPVCGQQDFNAKNILVEGDTISFQDCPCGVLNSCDSPTLSLEITQPSVAGNPVLENGSCLKIRLFSEGVGDDCRYTHLAVLEPQKNAKDQLVYTTGAAADPFSINEFTFSLGDVHEQCVDECSSWTWSDLNVGIGDSEINVPFGTKAPITGNLAADYDVFAWPSWTHEGVDDCTSDVLPTLISWTATRL